MDVGSVLILLAGAVVVTVWLGAQLAARLHGAARRLAWATRSPRPAAPPTSRRSPACVDPAGCTPAPGAPWYWASTVVAFAATASALAFGVRLFRGPRPGTARRKRLGIDTRARLARPADLRPLIVQGPTPGRMILGRVAGRLVATEDRRNAPYHSRLPRRQQRVGDRSAVCIIGPSRCGKTTNTISGILEWEGPAILSASRPTSSTPPSNTATPRRSPDLRPDRLHRSTRARWSPLRAAATVTGAQKAARALVDAAPRGRGRTSTSSSHGQAAPVAAAVRRRDLERTMQDVVHWILTQDRLLDEDTGAVAGRPRSTSRAPRRAAPQRSSPRLEAITAIWELDERTRGVNVRHLSDHHRRPGKTRRSPPRPVGCDIDLDWLLDGTQHPLPVRPIARASTASRPCSVGHRRPLATGLREVRSRQPAHPATLLVMDEAGNTPTRWLPAVAITCAGIGILLVTIWQSKAQIDAAYGRLADSVLTNHGTKIIFSGIIRPATLDYAAELLGDEEVVQRSISADTHAGPARNITQATTYLPLVPGEALRRVPPGEALLVYGTLHPAHLTTRPHLTEPPAIEPGIDPFAPPRLALPPAPKVIDTTAAENFTATNMVFVERLALIGDVGGHRNCLRACLRALDVNVDEHGLPDDLTIIQVGDLIGGSPDDDQLIADVDHLMQTNPGRWIQLLGNWEARHLGGTNFASPQRDRQPLAPASIATLRRWLTEQQLRSPSRCVRPTVTKPS